MESIYHEVDNGENFDPIESTGPENKKPDQRLDELLEFYKNLSDLSYFDSIKHRLNSDIVSSEQINKLREQIITNSEKKLLNSPLTFDEIKFLVSNGFRELKDKRRTVRFLIGVFKSIESASDEKEIGDTILMALELVDEVIKSDSLDDPQAETLISFISNFGKDRKSRIKSELN